MTPMPLGIVDGRHCPFRSVDNEWGGACNLAMYWMHPRPDDDTTTQRLTFQLPPSMFEEVPGGGNDGD